MTEDYAFERDDGEEIKVAGHKKSSENADSKPVFNPKSTQIAVNLNCDPGCLLVEDCQSYESISATEFSKRTAANLCTLYKQLFDLKKAQEA